MNKIYYILLLLLAVPLTNNAQTFPTSSWSNYADVSWYNGSQNTFTISTAEALAGLSQLVSQGNTFQGKSLIINADIDLGAHLWSPIGPNNDLPFSGSVDGGDFKISNLWINLPSGDWVGLF